MSKFKVGDKVEVDCCGDSSYDCIGYVCKLDHDGNVDLIEVEQGSYNGWNRDGQIPNEYKPICSDRYWYVCGAKCKKVKEEPEEQRVKDSGAIYRTSPQHDFERLRFHGFDVKITDNVEDKLKDYKPKKKTIMRSISNAIKKVLPGDEQKLYKVGLLNSDLELSGRAQEMYVQALYENEGDHKKAKAELVAYAEEQIKEEENN